MTDNVLEEITLLSHREKKGLRQNIPKQGALILGENQAGKSSLIKSIFWTLGAEPKFAPRWQDARTTCAVRFTVGRKGYVMVRTSGRNKFGLFSSSGKLLYSAGSVTNELAPIFAKVAGFGLQLADRQGKPRPAPPAYLFVPYYIDQDLSWGSPWSSFKNLGQFSHWKRAATEYHVGLKPDEYFKLTADSVHAREARAEAQRELKAIDALRTRSMHQWESASPSTSLEQFRAEVDELLVELNRLSLTLDEQKVKQLRLRNQKAQLEDQVRVVEAARRELSEDQAFAVRSLQQATVDCPTCGASYQNGFAERFAIAADEGRCNELLDQLSEDLGTVAAQIDDIEASYTELREEFHDVESLLAKKRGDLRLQDVIRAEGRRALTEAIASEVDAKQVELDSLEGRLEEIKEQQGKLANRERQANIKKTFKEHLQKFLEDLDARPAKIPDRLEQAPEATGSELPRTLLAYYFAIVHTGAAFSSAPKCPLVIDSPNQQAQDDIRLPKILKFLQDQTPKGRQLLVGVEHLHGMPEFLPVVKLKGRYSLLSAKNYEDCSSSLRPLTDQMPVDD